MPSAWYIVSMQSVADEREDKCDIEKGAKAKRETAMASAFRKVCFKEMLMRMSMRTIS